MKIMNKLGLILPATTVFVALSAALPGTALAGNRAHVDFKGEGPSCAVPCTTPWYVGGSIGMSHLFDKKTTGTSNSVDENGVGGNVNVGYQYSEMWGGELGYNYYSPSRETSGTTEVARTYHYSVYLAGTGRYRLTNEIEALGKLGVSYNYANKVFNTAPGSAAGAQTGSLYYALAAAYNLTRKTDFVLEWSRSLGNDTTGSADLYSFGVSVKVS